MKIALKPKEGKKGLPPTTSNLKIDDMNLSDSDREDYHNNVDILFVLDTTGSMGSYIQKSITTIEKIIEKFNKMEFDIKFALCKYRDHPPQEESYVTQFVNLCSSKDIIKVFQQTTVQGGGDIPEAVMDGLREGLTQTKWRVGEDDQTKSKRFLFHICDAPPHGIEYGSKSKNVTWMNCGCPCGTKRQNIAQLLQEKQVDYHLVKVSKLLNKMETLFKESFKDRFCDTIVIESSIPKSPPTVVEKSKHINPTILSYSNIAEKNKLKNATSLTSSTIFDRSSLKSATYLSSPTVVEKIKPKFVAGLTSSAVVERSKLKSATSHTSPTIIENGRLKSAVGLSSKKFENSIFKKEEEPSQGSEEMWSGVIKVLNKRLN